MRQRAENFHAGSNVKVEYPDLWNRVQSGWAPVQRLPATVGYGEITLWVPKADVADWEARAGTRAGAVLSLQPNRSNSRKTEQSAGDASAVRASRRAR